jgi:predicted RNase H-like HicB family nuclease
MEYRFLAIIEKGPESYGAYAPDVPGCGGVGDTPEEAVQSLKEALKLQIETSLAYGEKVPNATHIASEFVSVSVKSPVDKMRAS